MALKYYSDVLNKFYDTAEDCQKAEIAAKVKADKERMEKEKQLAIEKANKEKALAERKAKAEKVDAARKAVTAAREAYEKAEENLRNELTEFCNKYGTYHFSSDKVEDFLPTFFDWKDWLGNIFKF